MQNSVSPQLRKAGETITRIGKEIEDSQVEDGDPPFRVTRKQYAALSTSAKAVERCLTSLSTADDAAADNH